MFANSDMSISFRRNDFWDNLGALNTNKES